MKKGNVGLSVTVILTILILLAVIGIILRTQGKRLLKLGIPVILFGNTMFRVWSIMKESGMSVPNWLVLFHYAPSAIGHRRDRLRQFYEFNRLKDP